MIIYAYNLRHSHFSNHVGIDIPRLTLKERYLIKTWFKAAQLDCFLRFLGNFFKWSAKWCLGTNDEITLDGSGKNRYGQNAQVKFLVTGEIQRGANKELIRVGRQLVDYVMYEGKERRRFPKIRSLTSNRVFFIKSRKAVVTDFTW